MRIDIISALPDLLSSPLETSILSRAQKKKLVEIRVHDLREFASGKYRHVDDSPFGGGAGMVLKPEPLFACLKQLLAMRKYDAVIYLSPQGRKFTQKYANRLSLKENLLFLCGHYKGVDQRVIDKFVTHEISIGDYVLTGGEIAALVLTDAIVRLIPGVLGDSESALTDSFQTESGFDAPVYTRPAEFDGIKVPDVLLGGDHKKINEWRMEQGKTKYARVKRRKII